MFVDCESSADLPEIPNSLRFNGTSSYLSRTVTATGNRQTFCISWWVKRSEIGVLSYQFGAYFSNNQHIVFGADDTLVFNSGGIGTYFTSDAKFDDPTAWYHFVFAMDTTQATGNRFKFWCNCVYLTGAYTPATLNSAWAWNAIQSTYPNLIGDTTTLHNYPSQYMANICHIDGYPTGVNNANWDATNFGELFAYTDYNGQWRSKSKSDLIALINAGGTNSYFLSFENGASTSTLGYDASAKGNNWTLTSMVRDGSTNDCWTIDTPTNNFATISPIDKHSIATVLNGALDNDMGGSFGSSHATIFPSSGKWYCEFTATSAGLYGSVSVVKSGRTHATWAGNDTLSWAYLDNAYKYTNGAAVAYGVSWASGDTISTLIDIDAGTIIWWKNGVSQGTAYTGIGAGSFTFGFGYANTNGSVNFGQRPVSGGVDDRANSGGYFRYAPPAGYKALCRKNIQDGTVTTSGTFTGNAAADGPFVYLNGTPTAMTIDGNAVTWGTHADKLANGFKIRTASSPYNDAASNSYTVTTNAGVFKYNSAESN